MSLAAIAALVVTAVLVAALAFYLIWVIVILRRLTDTLGKVSFGVHAIALRVSPIQPIVENVNSDLTAVAGALEDLVADLTVRRPAHAS